MKKKFLISIIVLLIIVIITICIFWAKGIIFSDKNNPYSSNEEVTVIEEEKYVDKEDNGIVKDKESGTVLYDPSEDYSNSSEISMNYQVKAFMTSYDAQILLEYTKYFLFIYPERSFDSFSDLEIASIVALASELYIPRTIEEVQSIAKMYFDIDNYELPTGTYKIEKYGDFTITKIDGYYVRSEIQNKKKLIIDAFMAKAETNGNQVILYLDFVPNSFVGGEKGCYSPLNEVNEEKCIIGYYQFYFTYDENRINIDKIIYEKNDKYIAM